jgi:hypothetical protein
MKNLCNCAALIAFSLILAGNTAARADSGAFVRRWRHESETSAVIYWQMADISSSAYSYVEYGETGSLGSRTAISARPRRAQLHYLTGLEPGTTYYYRMVNVDATTGLRTESEVLSFRTLKEGAVRAPEEVAGSPCCLDRPQNRADSPIIEKSVSDGNKFEE